MEQLLAIKDDPEKLEAALQGYWKNFDPQARDLLLMKISQELALNFKKHLVKYNNLTKKNK